jgi:membrane fusion protein (multidrug efflux system)
VAETQAVHAGDALVLLDDADQRIALAAATAELSKAERQVRGYFANNDALAAQVAARNADIAHAQAGLDSAQADFNRVKSEYGHRQTLAPAGYASGEEVTRAGAALQVAAATLAAARAACDQAAAAEKAAMATLEANKVLTDGTTVETNPEVMAARTRVEQARLDLDRTIIRAPLDGVVTRRQVQIGDRAQIGAPLMDIVPVGATFVDANFKEAQLRDVRIGQPVELVSDLYGSSVRYHGRVVGLSGGTGAAFAVIPAQNATGNWIKVVQRLPVRIAFDAGELARNPVRVGLSMTAVIDTAGTGH